MVAGTGHGSEGYVTGTRGAISWRMDPPEYFWCLKRSSAGKDYGVRLAGMDPPEYFCGQNVVSWNGLRGVISWNGSTHCFVFLRS